MSDLKVYEYAKELGLETLALMDKIKKWKLPVKSHMSALSGDLIDQIQAKIKEEVQASKEEKITKKTTATKKTAAKKKTTATKKTVTKKAVTKKTVTKKAVAKKTTATKKTVAKKKTVTKKAVTKKTVTKKAVAQKETASESDSTTQGATVIRRRAQVSTEEQRAQEAADIRKKASERKEQQVAAGVDLSEEESRSNIVGRIDLGALQKPSPTITRAPERNIRPGFAPAPTPVYDSPRGPKEDPYKKKKTTDGAKEQKPAQFTATEFRKREVIFQPKKKRVLTQENKKTQITTPKAVKRMVNVHKTISLQALADQMKVKAPALIKKLISEGVMANMNTELDFDTVSLIVPDFGFQVQNTYSEVEEKLQSLTFGDTSAEPVIRPPVITVMGHVDHGKTTLLDTIRSADVASREAGGITQHIGAYRVTQKDGKVATFIDTPGHAAFTAMRQRGANVTDIVIIVVAADDGMMPQTEEAISHAKAAGVPIIVAINKMDAPGADTQKIKQQLAEHELLPEDWGGETICCEVSALKNTGIEGLLEQIHLVAELQELKGNPKSSATGVVIESRVDKGRGAVATLLIKDGTIRNTDYVVAGQVTGKVRRMQNDRGETVEEIGPGEPVEILGLDGPPQAGDRFDICESEAIALEVAEQRKEEVEKEAIPNSSMSLDDLFAKAMAGDLQELTLILKSDMAGSNEAIKGMLAKAETDEVKVKVIHSGVGAISESDVLLGSTSGALILGFNVRPDTVAQRVSKEKGVTVKTYSIIYELIDDVKKSMGSLLAPDIVEEDLGQAEVRETFSVPKIGTIAGCSVTNGKITRNSLVRLVRDGTVIYHGELSSLKRFKDDAKEVQSGYECGIGIEKYNDIKVGDVIEAYQKKEVARQLEG